MKKFYTVLLICLMSSLTYAQTINFEWAKSSGGASSEISKSITISTSGYVYITGSFEGTVDFDPGAAIFNLTSSGGADVFVQKLDANGNFIWAKSMGGISNEIGRCIATDASGFIYLTGYFEGSVDFDPGLTTYNLTSNGIDDVFIQKLDSLGNFVWAKSIGGAGSDRSFSIKTDNLGNVFATGKFRNTVDFDPGALTYNITSTGGEEVFILKLNGGGDFLWAKSIEGSMDDEGRSVTTDAFGNIYLSGNFKGTVDFDPGISIFNLTSIGSWDVFILKLNNSGDFDWAKSYGGTDRDGVNCITVDASGNSYVTGKFQNTVDFDPGASAFNLTSNGDYDIFIQKLDSLGNFIWAKSVGAANYDQGESIIADGNGNIYVTGYYQLTSDFDPGSSNFNMTSNGVEDIFILKLDGLGNFNWASSIGGANFDTGNSITSDAVGNLYISGYYQGAADFDPGASIFNLTSNGSEDVYVVKFSQAPTSVSENSLFNKVVLYPNPNDGIVNIDLGLLKEVSLKVFSLGTQIVYQIENISAASYQFELNAASGIYFVEISSQNERHYYKLVKK